MTRLFLVDFPFYNPFSLFHSISLMFFGVIFKVICEVSLFSVAFPLYDPSLFIPLVAFWIIFGDLLVLCCIRCPPPFNTLSISSTLCSSIDLCWSLTMRDLFYTWRPSFQLLLLCPYRHSLLLDGFLVIFQTIWQNFVASSLYHALPSFHSEGLDGS